MIELEHSPLGGSAANRFINCGGSFLLHRELLQAGEHETIPSEYAALGTAAHELGAMCLVDKREPFEFIGQKIDRFAVGDNDGEIHLDSIALYVNLCERILSENANGQILIETTIHKPEVHRLLKGTVDFGFWNPSKLFLIDYKNGEGIPVAAAGNRQLLYYGFLMVLEYPWLQQQSRDFPCHLGIVQPNLHGIYEEPEIWETDLGTILDFGWDLLIPRMKELDRPQDIGPEDFNPGDHCQFCPVMLECPRLQQAYQTFVNGTEFLDMLTDEEVSAYYAERPHAKRFMNELDKVVFARLMGKKSIASAKLVEKRVNRVWKPGAKEALVARFGSKAFNPPEIKSPAQIEKMSSDGKALALEHGYKPDATGFSVAPIDDRRPAAAPPANAEVFASFAGNPEDQGF